MTMKWYESANEAAFKQVANGYVFQSPNPWMIARPRYYLVNETQKAGIAACLARWRLFLTVNLIAAALVLASVMQWSATLIESLHAVFPLGVGSLTVLMIVLLTSVMVLLVAPPHIYLMRSLRPLLAGAPRTSERITMREQLSTTAAFVSGKILMVGLIAAIGMMIGSVLMLAGAFLNGELARALIHYAPLFIIGGLLSGHFLHIIRLKAKLKRVAA